VRYLRDDLLNPLPDSSPRGENLRYASVYDKIKEARQEDDDDSPQGEWQRQRKKADLPAVFKLAGDVLATKSKDLQVAAWLCEALLRREGFAALPECIFLIHELQLRFWDILYPELDNGSPEFRATPGEWFSSRCDYLLRRIPIAGKSFDWLKYKESRTIPYENDLRDDKDKARREEAVTEQRPLPEEFDSAFNSTPKSFYVAACVDLEAATEALASLEAFCDEKYGNVAPNFGKVRNVLSELKQGLEGLLKKKRELEPDPAPAGVAEIESALAETTEPQQQEFAQPTTETPKSSDPEEIFAIIGRLAAHMRKTDPQAVAAYLLSRSARWGELRSAGDSLDSSLLAAPSTDLRQNLKRFSNEGNWEELLNATETAMVSPCGRAWLDLQRYAWTACSQLGYYAVAKAICSELRALVRDFPSLPTVALADDTPAANPETRAWIEQNILDPQPEPSPVFVDAAPQPRASVNGHTDHYQEAAQLARAGRMVEAMELLGRNTGDSDSGREKFLRHLRVSQLCLNTGHFAIAYPILQDLFAEMQRRELLDWEGTDFVVEPLKLLVQCIDKTSQDTQERARIYNLLCRLEPGVALQLQRS